MRGCQSDREVVVPDRPRERLDALGASALSDAELVALLIRTGNRGSNALAVATELLGRYGGLQCLSRVSGHELGRSQGIGPAKSATNSASLRADAPSASSRSRGRSGVTASRSDWQPRISTPRDRG